MCLAVPAEVISIDDGVARVSISGNVRECLVDLVPGVEVGDYVLMHAGYAVQIIEPEDAEETINLLREAYSESKPGGP